MPTLLETLASYLPDLIIQQHRADSGPPGEPARSQLRGALLFADISGFTALTEQLAQRGPGGVEDLTRLLNTSFGQILDTISLGGGDVLSFAGDAMLALWPADGGDLAAATRHAAQCALAIHSRMSSLYRLIASQPLTLRIGVACGDLATLRVGGMYGRWLFLITGDPLVEVGAAEHRARPGEVVLAPSAWAEVRRWCAGSPAYADDDTASGYMRLNAIHAALIPPALTPPRLLPTMEASLSAYIAGAALGRIRVNQTTWLAELRRVTVLFVNLPMINHQMPLDLAQQVMWAIQASLYRYEGSVNKISVDDKGVTLVAALGLPPLAHEDDAARGVQAALAIGQALGDLGQRCAIGVTSGRAFCGEIGSPQRREYTMIGAIVNLAARLMQAAPMLMPAEAAAILCDEPTYLAGRARLAFAPLPPIIVKGRAEPVVVYRPRQVAELGGQRHPHVTGISLGPTAHSQMVGRDAEQSALAAQLRAMQASDQGGVVIIEGEAGMGKSRLVEALIQQADRLRITAFIGAGDAMERSTPYSAWRGIFGQLFDLNIISTPDARRAHMLSLIEDDEEIAPLAALLNVVLPLDLPESEVSRLLSGPGRADATRALLLRLLQDSTSRSPKLLILEDAHWFDSASWALALAVSQRVRSLLLVITSRPPGASGAPDLAAPEYAQLSTAARLRIALDALSPAQAIALVCHRLGVAALPEPVAALIREKAQGNPFFSEELAYALRDAGLLRIERGVCGLAPDADLRALAFPETVQGAIVSRIDRLAPTQQLTLKVASVIGRVFPVRTLAAIYPIITSHDGLASDLETLERLDITPLDAIDPELTYSFKHAITQDVVYNLMLFAQRRQLHRAAAEWYEQSYAGDLAWLYPLLAYHWDKAGVVERAITYFERAGRSALAVSATREARALFEQALGLLAGTPEPQREMLLLRLFGEASRQLGEFTTARSALDRSLAHARALGDQCGMIDALSQLGLIATDTGNFALARTYLEEGYALAHAAGETLRIAQTGANLANLAWRRQNTNESDRYYQESLALFTALADRPGIAQVLNGMGNNAAGAGIYDVACACYEESLAIRRVLGERWGVAACLSNLGWVAHLRHDYAGARIHYEESLSIQRAIGDQRGIGIVLNNLGFTLCAIGDDQAAAACFDEGLRIATTIGATPLILELLVGVARLRARAGRPAEAAELIGLALRHPSSGMDVRGQVDPFLAELGALLPADQIAAAMERGGGRDLAATVVELRLPARA